MIFDAGPDWTNPGFAQSDESLVVAITHQDAEAYAGWLSESTGKTYRLQTEDEWEWAAWGDTQTIFPWGNGVEAVDLHANSYDVTSSEVNVFAWGNMPVTDGFPCMVPAGSFESNGFGLYDMIRNAREFTSDNWICDLRGASVDGSAQEGQQSFLLLRGGAWNYQPQNLRVAYRSVYFSSEVARNMFGFRVVCEL